MKYGRILVYCAVLFLVSCAGQYSEDPETKSLQIWADACFSYTETLGAVNDMIELELLSPSEITVVGGVRDVVGPLCESEQPPVTGDRASIQALIDAQLLRLIKLKKGLE